MYSMRSGALTTTGCGIQMQGLHEETHNTCWRETRTLHTSQQEEFRGVQHLNTEVLSQLRTFYDRHVGNQEPEEVLMRPPHTVGKSGSFTRCLSSPIFAYSAGPGSPLVTFTFAAKTAVNSPSARMDLIIGHQKKNLGGKDHST